MLAFAHVKLAVEDRVAVVTIDHPPANALNQTTMASLLAVFDQLEADDQVKAVILTGEGRFFVAGADIREFVGKTPQEGQAMAEAGQNLFLRIEQFCKPVIAAVNGACLGGGLELAMACHIRMAAPEAKLGLPECNLGLIPGYGGTQRLPRLIGPGKATKMILTGEMISGEEAQAVGLVEAVHPLERLLAEAKALAAVFAQKSAVATRFALDAIRTGYMDGFQSGLRREAELFGQAFGSEDMKEGVNAFLEKRKAQFRDC